jgi:hypothetical protein
MWIRCVFFRNRMLITDPKDVWMAIMLQPERRRRLNERLLHFPLVCEGRRRLVDR